jgi:hypothetical protein
MSYSFRRAAGTKRREVVEWERGIAREVRPAMEAESVSNETLRKS